MATPSGPGASMAQPASTAAARRASERRDHDESASPRTSFCLLEAASDDRDSAVSAPVAAPSPHGFDTAFARAHNAPPAPVHAAMTSTNSAPTVAAVPHRRQVSYTHSGSMTPTSSTAATIASAPVRTSPRKHMLQASTSTVSIPPLLDQFEHDGSVAVAEDDGADHADLDSMRALFRVDSSVYANPDNIAPSLQTSIIMGESQIVGVNGTLGSLYPGKRRQRRATDAISLEAAGLPSIQSHQSHPSLQDHYGAHRQQHLHHTGDTIQSSVAGGDIQLDPELTTGGSDDFSGRDTSICDTKPISAWHWLCCCWPARPPAPIETKETMTLSQFAKSLWERLHMTWDSYFLFFTLALAVCSIPLASGLAVAFQAAKSIAFHARCEFREGNNRLSAQDLSTAMLTSVVIPMMNHIVLLLVSLWIAIRCSYSRKRVLKSSPSSMNTTLTSAFMLPCFEFMWYTISFLNLAGVVLSAVSFGFESSKKVPTPGSRLDLDMDAPYPCDLVSIPFTWMLQLLPFLMAQHSVSHEAVRRAIVYSGLICLLIVVLQITLFKEGHVAMGAISIGVHVMLLSFYCWAKFLSHARSSFDFFFVVAILDSVTAITVEIIAMASSSFSTTSPYMVGRSVVMSLDAILTVAMLLSLRADTRYWLGLDDPNTSARHPFKRYMRHLSERGMITNFSTRTSVYDVHRMIEEHRNCVVDFSALKLECVIAQGATSIVMRGLMRSKPIALKIYTSVQVTDEEVRRFSRETALNVQLSHPNIVKFHGLCVVPPSISLVFEFCEYGGLDGVLGNGSMHSLSTKLRAWLDACRAVAYLHSFSPPLLHRDIKTDNFLVGQDFTLKLADFGEANLLKPRTDGTMTIAGTVDYMAPEMILGGKTARYGTGVDVYSLMITLWQIMVPDRSPWEGRSHLEVYNCVTNGERPPLLPSIPSGCAEILEAGWVANPLDRVAVEDIIPKVHQLWLLSTHQKTLRRTK